MAGWLISIIVILSLVILFMISYISDIARAAAGKFLRDAKANVDRPFLDFLEPWNRQQ